MVAGTYGPEPFIDRAGNAIADAEVSVFDSQGGPLSSLFSDITLATPLTNPLPTSVDEGVAGLDEQANGLFYASPGTYFMQVKVDGVIVWSGPIRVEVNRPVAEGAQVVSLKDAAFGCVGDGVADDTAAAQAAVDSLAATGGVLLVVPGLFLLSSSLLLPSHVHLLGCGGTFVVTPTFGDVAIVRNSVNNPANDGARQTDIVVDGVRFDGTPNLTATEFNAAVELRAVTHSKVRDCYMLGPVGDGVYVGAAQGVAGIGCEDVLVSGNSVVACGRQGITLISGRRIKIVDNDIDTPTLNGVDVEPNAATDILIDVQIVGNTVKNGSHGIGVLLSVTSPSNTYGIVVARNLVEGTTSVTGDGIGVTGAQGGVAVVDNVIRNSQRFGIYFNGGQRVTCTGNNISGCTQYPIRTEGLTRFTIADNVIDTTGTDGMRVESQSQRGVIRGNVIKVAAGSGVRCDNSSHIGIVGNFIEGDSIVGGVGVNINKFSGGGTYHVVGLNTLVNLLRGVQLNAATASNRVVSNECYEVATPVLDQAGVNEVIFNSSLLVDGGTP